MVPTNPVQLARAEERVKCLEVRQDKQDILIQGIQDELKKLQLQVQAQTIKLTAIISISQILLAVFLRHIR